MKSNTVSAMWLSLQYVLLISGYIVDLNEGMGLVCCQLWIPILPVNCSLDLHYCNLCRDLWWFIHQYQSGMNNANCAKVNDQFDFAFIAVLLLQVRCIGLSNSSVKPTLKFS